jgi:DNA-binding NarL/FixJ family response regulator
MKTGLFSPDANGGSPNGKLSVLLAEDNDVMLRSIWQLLERDFDVVGAVSDGNLLLETAEKFAADVIVLDISMPGVDGVEAARRLLADGCGSSIVFLTAHGQPAIVRAALETGARGFVVKSRAAQELIPAIRAVASGGRFVSPSVGESLTDAR